MKYRWVMRPVEQPEAVARLQRELNDLPEALARALVLRGVDTFDAARRFFRPTLDDLHDPFSMRDMDAAADRLARAVRESERVLVYGDYDVDGTTSTALMAGILRSLGVDAHYFIPDRIADGYGLGPAGIDRAEEIGAALIVALDCGITAVEQAAYARSKGLDLVICDHHTAAEEIPDAVAVLDPKRPGCPYPFKELSGCGVGFKLAQATLRALGEDEDRALAFLDLVAVSTASDIVPVYGENRVLLHEGLNRLKDRPRLGFRALAQHAGVDLAQCTSTQILFSLGPRINAAGRMGDAGRAVALLMSDDAGEADRLAAALEDVNRHRQTVDRATLEEARRQADGLLAGRARHSLVLHQDDWHPGVIGIVASRIVEHYYRPAVLLATVNGIAKGSARSIAGVNIYQALKACEDLLITFGGHDYAAGMSLEVENVPAFRTRFEEAVARAVTDEVLQPVQEVDAPLDLRALDARFWAVLKQFAPFGPENLAPVFHGRDLELVGPPRTVGRTNEHIKLRVRQRGQPGDGMDVIGFGLHTAMPDLMASHHQGLPLELLFNVEENTWKGKTTLQLKAKDVRLEES